MTDSVEKQDLNEVFRQLGTSPNGLNEDQVKVRLGQYGYNTVEKEKESEIKKFLLKFWSPVPWMLEFTALISYILGKRVDTYIILALLLFNSLVSFFQESKANNALELLEKKMMTNARVLRNSAWIEVQSKNLVPGDIIHCRLGDLVPADIKMMSGEILVDQSALTGGSNAVSKVAGNLLYSGSVLKRGESTGVVVATGSKTFFGKTAELVKVAKSDSHLEKLILWKNLSKRIAILYIPVRVCRSWYLANLFSYTHLPGYFHRNRFGVSCDHPWPYAKIPDPVYEGGRILPWRVM